MGKHISTRDSLDSKCQSSATRILVAFVIRDCRYPAWPVSDFHHHNDHRCPPLGIESVASQANDTHNFHYHFYNSTLILRNRTWSQTQPDRSERWALHLGSSTSIVSQFAILDFVIEKRAATCVMVKVKLRVPLSSAPRDSSSPLTNPLRSAPDYSDDDDPATALRDDGTPDDTADIGGSDAEDFDDDPDDDDQEADELDELDELEGEDDESSSKTASTSTLTKRRSITLKPRSSSSKGDSSLLFASSSADGSVSPQSSADRLVKRGSLARMVQVQSLSVEELDALPAAKRRKTAKARGAAGPGRGWRKGLTKGQKPVYELPPAERTPATFSSIAPARSSPSTPTAIKAETPVPVASAPPPLKPKPIPNLAASAAGADSSKASTPSAPARSTAAPTTISSSIKIVSGPGGQTFTGDLSAKAGTAKNPGFRYPPLPGSRAGPPVQPIARIPTAFQTVVPLERNARQPRRWIKAKREILSMGGRPWSIPVFYGGEDRGYEKKIDAPTMAGALSTMGSTTTAAGGAERVVAKAGTPSAAAVASTGKTASPAPATPAASANTSTTTAAAQNSSVATSTTTLAKAGSPLPPPKHLNGLNAQAETNWRGQSPAFLFGGR